MEILKISSYEKKLAGQLSNIKINKETTFKFNANLAIGSNTSFPLIKFIDRAYNQSHNSKSINQKSSIIKKPNSFLKKLLISQDIKVDNNTKLNSSDNDIEKIISNYESKLKNKRILASGVNNAITNNTESSTIHNRNRYNRTLSIKYKKKFKHFSLPKNPLSFNKKVLINRKINNSNLDSSNNITSELNINHNQYTIPINNNNISYNITKIIKNIKTNASNNIFTRTLAYDEKLENVVFDASRVINKHRLKDSAFQNYKGISKFINDNKEISVNNIMLKLVNKRNKRITLDNIEREKNITLFKDKITDRETNFMTITDIQKTSYFKISESLEKIQQKNLILLECKYKLLSNWKQLEEEIYRKIDQINSLRKYGKFVNEVLNDDPSFFQYEIIQEYDNKMPDINYIISKIFEIYQNLLVGKDKNNYFLNEPELMITKFEELNKRIIIGLQTNENLYKEIIEIKKERENTIKELIQKKK